MFILLVINEFWDKIVWPWLNTLNNITLLRAVLSIGHWKIKEKEVEEE